MVAALDLDLWPTNLALEGLCDVFGFDYIKETLTWWL